MKEDEKRVVPSPLKTILDIDVRFTHSLVKFAEKFLPMKQLKVHYRALEISCHGVPWIASLLAFIWILDNKNLYQMQINLLMGFLLDIVIVGILKAITRRRRPAVSDDIFAVGPDKYSFPSGHASRAMLVLYFFTTIWPVSVFFFPSLVAWAFCICVSRLLTRRHHVLDICAGIVIGILEGMLVGVLYLEPQTCENLVAWLSGRAADTMEEDM